MNTQIEKDAIHHISEKLAGLSKKSVEAVLELADQGSTVPFIARYRKEKTGNLDEVQIRTILDERTTFVETEKRRAFVVKEIEAQGNMNAELKMRLEKAADLAELEEIYRPFKKKKKTKATLAREAGLEPLALWILSVAKGEESPGDTTLEVKAKEFLRPKEGIVTYDLALKGAQDILVEMLSNSVELRAKVKEELLSNGLIVATKGKDYKVNSKYAMYEEFSEPIHRLFDRKNSHRYMAMRRGWQEGELQVTLKGDEELFRTRFEKHFVTSSSCPPRVAEFLKTSAQLALSVYVLPSLSNEIHKMLKDSSEDHAIEVFTDNVRTVLLGSPLGAKCVLGVDPGVRTGCKIALVDKSGRFISDTVIRVQGEKAFAQTSQLLKELTSQIQLDAIAVGNGTGGREAEAFLRKVLVEIGLKVPVVMVSESGASVYSASDIAREEFPDLDLTVRGAISIARRLQDPLSELVKVDPKSIGVGQYQHDVSQSKLKKSLHEAVESCVNRVGVEVNTASESLLSYVAGIGPALAKNIVQYRQQKGLIKERQELLKVEKFGNKSFEQAAGFLRVASSPVKLDQTGIHPERYQAVKDMLSEAGLTVGEVLGKKINDKLLGLRPKWSALIGEYTFDDILVELEKPGRDPRDPFKATQFRDDLFEVKDVKEGMICPGIVTNVTNFGAFVDIGVHQDGLVHISELSDQFVDDPRKVVKPGDAVQVRVLKVDVEKSQLSFSMKLESKKARADVRLNSEEGRPAQDRPKRAAFPKHTARTEPSSKSVSAQPQLQPQRPKRSLEELKAKPLERPKGGNSRGSQPKGDYHQQREHRPASKPFNNPFAALMGDLTNDKK